MDDRGEERGARPWVLLLPGISHRRANLRRLLAKTCKEAKNSTPEFLATENGLVDEVPRPFPYRPLSSFEREFATSRMLSTFLQLAGFSLSSAGVEIDSTPPVVVDLYSPKGTSPWGGVYTVGEEVRGHV